MTRAPSWLAPLCLVLAVASCGGDDGDSGNCDRFEDPQAEPGDPIDGDTFDTFAEDFFDDYCTRCHSTTKTGDQRNGAPVGFNWDDETSVRAHLADIRGAVGVSQFMPPSAPTPSCDDRQRIVRWIDADAP